MGRARAIALLFLPKLLYATSESILSIIGEKTTLTSCSFPSSLLPSAPPFSSHMTRLSPRYFGNKPAAFSRGFQIVESISRHKYYIYGYSEAVRSHGEEPTQRRSWKFGRGGFSLPYIDA